MKVNPKIYKWLCYIVVWDTNSIPPRPRATRHIVIRMFFGKVNFRLCLR